MNQHAPYRRWLRRARQTMQHSDRDNLFRQADLYLAATKKPDAGAPGSTTTAAKTPDTVATHTPEGKP